MIITPSDMSINISFEVYINGEKAPFRFIHTVDTDRKLIQILKTDPDNPHLLLKNKNYPDCATIIVSEDIYCDFELRAILYEDGPQIGTDSNLWERGRIKEVITDLEQIEAALILDKLLR